MLSEYEERSREEEDIMDPGGSVEPVVVKVKRTRAPNKVKEGGSGAGVKAETVGKDFIFLLVDKDGNGRTLSKEEFAVEAAKAIQSPDVWTLLRAEKVEPKITF